MKKQLFKVTEETELLSFLLAKIDRGRNYIKGVLARGQVYVDGNQEKRYNAMLTPGQSVEVLKQAPISVKFSGMRIMFEDEDIIVINKEVGLLTIASKKGEKQLTAYRQLMAYVQQSNPKARIFIVHRLDRDTSGVMIFAKNERTKHALQENWKHLVKERAYIALVEGKVKKQQDTITSWLKETKTHQMYISKNAQGAKQAVLHYTVMDQSSHYSLLRVTLETGRKNQIRVQLASIGHPVVGDKKYQATTNPIGRLGLHASVLRIRHPWTKEFFSFESPIPKRFKVKGL
ncbi:RluA family pseudouridine synthase [Amphibacillus sediminis]|uniref:RluA family pseudouridine synthase n=1 Tax=Amphibacillus sediminis TaxID=360185 RepID=UPI00082D3661|nr:RluA family pseudouridine synthase [Amphibacillus sediminis]